MKRQLLILISFFTLSQSFAQEFITTWKTDNPGTSNNTSITIPTFPGLTYSYDVDWDNDGNYNIADIGYTGDVTHDFGAPGTYTIRIRGTFPSIYFNNAGDKEKILSVDQWGIIAWETMELAFAGCSNLSIPASDTPNLTGVTSLKNMFALATSFNDDISNWNTSNITDMTSMFFNATSFNQNIGNWNTSLVITMSGMFAGADSFNQNIGSWNMENVNNVFNMFLATSGMSIENYDALLIGWDAQNLQPNLTFSSGSSYCNGSVARANMIASDGWTINDAGEDCSANYFITTWKTDNPGASNNTSITIPTFSSLTYNYDVDWENDGTFDNMGVAGNITHDYGTIGTYTVAIRGQFPAIRFGNTDDKSKIISIDQWGTNSWESMNFAFSGTNNLVGNATDIPDLSNVTDMSGMFSLSSFNQDIGNWNTSNVTNMSNLFENNSIFNQDIGSWDISNVIFLRRMFKDASVFNQDLNNWNTSNVTSMRNMFENATSFNGNISWNNTSMVTDMQNMFSNASSFNRDISNWDTSSVINMRFMFRDAIAFNQDIGNWSTGNVTNMLGMFLDATSFNQNLNNWNVSQVTNMNSMFSGTTSFNGDLSWNDTSSVDNMGNMFQDATVFNQDISNWNTSSVTRMESMFQNASLFNQNISSWDTSSVTNMSSMFASAQAFDQNLGVWNVENVTSFNNMFSSVTLSSTNYDALLIGWDGQNLNANVTFNGGNSEYCSTAAQTARDNMINNDGWSITDGGACPALSTDEFELNAISLYPNPARSEFYIKGMSQSVEVVIFDILGKEIFRESNYSDTAINTKEFKSGIYLVKVKNETGSKTLKLVIE